jgi:hypothetical protein
LPTGSLPDLSIGTEALVSGRSYLLKLGTATVKAKLEPRLQVMDLEKHEYRVAPHLAVNDIGTAVVALDRPVAVDRYADCRETGSFILIDPESCDTIGMGIVETIEPAEARGLTRHRRSLSGLIRATETHGRSIAKAVSWRATGSLDTFLLALGGRRRPCRGPDQDSLYYFHERVWALIPWGRR